MTVNDIHFPLMVDAMANPFIFIRSYSLFVKVNSMVGQASSVTPTSRVFSVFANSTMAMANMSTEFPGFAKPGRLETRTTSVR